MVLKALFLTTLALYSTQAFPITEDQLNALTSRAYSRETFDEFMQEVIRLGKAGAFATPESAVKILKQTTDMHEDADLMDHEWYWSESFLDREDAVMAVVKSLLKAKVPRAKIVESVTQARALLPRQRARSYYKVMLEGVSFERFSTWSEWMDFFYTVNNGLSGPSPRQPVMWIFPELIEENFEALKPLFKTMTFEEAVALGYRYNNWKIDLQLLDHTLEKAQSPAQFYEAFEAYDRVGYEIRWKLWKDRKMPPRKYQAQRRALVAKHFKRFLSVGGTAEDIKTLRKKARFSWYHWIPCNKYLINW